MGATSVRLRVLDTFAVAVDGTPLELSFPSRRSEELVQLLALAPQHRLVRDVVIDALWPHLDAAAGAANLRKAAHHARQALGDPDAVELRRDVVTMFPGAVITTDVEDVLLAADAALASADAEAAAAIAERAGAEVLPTSRYEAWAEPTRAGLRDRLVRLLELIGDWERLVALDPLDEDRCRQAMESAWRRGQRHRALALFRTTRTALAHELGVDPSPATQALHDRIVAEMASPPPTIVGRDAELVVLDQLGHTASGTAVARVRGPAGIGKSALCRAVARRAADRGQLVVQVTAGDPADAYRLLGDVVARVVAARPGVVEQLHDKTRAVLARLDPAMRADAALEMGLTRHQVVGAVQQLVAAAAGEHGTWLLVDEAHQADEASLAALELLGDRDVGRLLTVLAHRREHGSEVLRRFVRRVAHRAEVRSIDLEPLDSASVELLARSAGAELDERRLERLVSRSGGNPFVALELLRHGSPSLDAPLAPALRDAITERFVALDDAVLGPLRRLALVDGQLDLTTVRAVGAVDDDDADAVLDAALAAGVLEYDEGGYRFVHDLVREALAEELPPHRRRTVHAEIGEALAAAGARPGLVAQHLLRGDRPDQAVPWLARAAEEAMSLGGFGAAVTHCDQVLALVPRHVAARRMRAQSLDALGDLRALAAYDAAIEVSSLDDAHELRPLQALAQIKLGDPEGALVTVAGTRPRSLESRVAQALTWCGAAALGVADPEEGTRLAAECRQAAVAAGDTASVVISSWAQAAAAHARGELRTSLQMDLQDTYALPKLAVIVFDGQLCITQRLLYGARPYEDVIEWADRFRTEASRLGAARGVAFATTLRGEAALLSGRHDDAIRDLREGHRLHEAIGGATGMSLALQRLAEAALDRGDRREARRLLDEALAVARESDIGFHLLDRIYGTRIRLAGDADEALATVVEAEDLVQGPFETCPGCRITLAVPAAIATATAGDLDRTDSYEQACTYLADVVMRLPAWYAALDEVRGTRCLAHGDARSARTHLEAAHAGFVRAGQPVDADRVRARLVSVPDR